MKGLSLFVAYREVRDAHPEFAGLGAWKISLRPELTERERIVCARAHSASRAGEYHDPESVVEAKSRFFRLTGICPEWDGDGRAV